MSYKRKKLEALGFDLKEWQRHYHQHQIEYLRVRLRCLKLFCEGESFCDVAQQLQIGDRTVRTNINRYLSGGYPLLLKRVSRQQPTLLTSEQEAHFKQAILTTLPTEHGLKANIWTASVMIEYLQNVFDVTYRSGIYELLYRLNMSHQRAHADYINADPAAQSDFIVSFQNLLYNQPLSTAIVFADEFSVCEKPTTYYGWAEKNTRPIVSTNEKKVSE